MAQLSAILSADNTGLIKAVEDAKRTLEQYSDEIKKNGKTNANVTNDQISAYQRVVKAMSQASNGSKTLAQQEKILKAQVVELKAQFANLSEEAKRSDFGKSISQSCKTAQAQLKALQAQMQSIGKEQSKLSSNVKKGIAMPSFDLKGVASSAGLGALFSPWTAAAAGLASVMGQVVSVNSDFEKQQSVLKAVTGQTAEQLSKLTEQAKQLGATTMYSASDIAELQINLAKLGFDTTQIEKMTTSVQAFATAVGTDLGSSAEMVGAALRQFNLSAEESGKVTDVLAKACSASALDFSYLNTAMSQVAPVANAFGMSIEDCTTLLGTLANSGFDASSAATATRAILLNLANDGGKLAKALGRPVKDVKGLMSAFAELQAKGIDLASALELTDKQSVAAFSSFLSNASAANELADTLQNCAGAAQQMSDIMSDNLDGDLKGLGSAWEGLMLSLGGGQDVFRSIVQGLTSMVQSFTETIKAATAWAKDLYDNSMFVRGVVEALVLTFQVAFKTIVTIVKDCINSIKGFAKILGKILQGDFSGAEAEWKKMLEKRTELFKDYVEEVKKQSKEAWKAVENGRPDNATSSTETTNSVTNKTTSTSTTTNNTTNIETTKKKVEVDKTQLDKLKDDLKQLEHQRENIDITTDGADDAIKEINTKIEAKRKEIEDFEIKVGIKQAKSSLQQLKDDLKVLEEIRANIDIDAPDADEQIESINKQIDKNLKKQYDIEVTLGIKKPKEKQTKVVAEEGSIAYLENQISDLNTQYKLAIDDESRKNILKQVESLQAQIESMEMTPKMKFDSIKEGIASVIGDIQNLYDAFGNLSENFDEMSAGEKFFAIANAIISTIDTVESLCETFKTMSKMIQAIGSVATATSSAVVAANSAETASEEIKTTAKMGSAAAGFFEAHSWIPYVGAAIAGAMIAAMIATMSQFHNGGIVGKFASGGMIGGSTTIGDYNLARVNGGEMILNSTQQGRLFKLLDSQQTFNNGYGGGQVEFKLRGTDLIGLMKNTQNRISKI